MSDIPIVNDTPFNNKFTMLCAGIGIVWIASIVAKKTMLKTPMHEYSQNKRYMIKQQSKLNREITHLNRNNVNPFANKLPNYFGRHKRFNRSR